MGNINQRRVLYKYLSASVLALCVTWFMAVTASAQTRGVVTANSVNVRDAGSLTNSTVLFMVDRGQAVEIYDVQGDYYQVSVQDQPEAYIAREYVKITQTDGVAMEEAVWIYETPSDSDGQAAIGLIGIADTVTVTASCKDWYYVTCNGITGYVPKQYLYIPPYAALQETKPAKTAYAAGNASLDEALADEIISYAKEFLGTKYIYGSMNPNKGFDCSGFVNYVMNNFDISLNRSSAYMASDGVGVDRSELQKCDLVFFATSGGNRISHVGMYIGNGQFIHASSQGEGVMITNLSEQYYSKRFVKATRVI